MGTTKEAEKSCRGNAQLKTIVPVDAHMLTAKYTAPYLQTKIKKRRRLSAPLHPLIWEGTNCSGFSGEILISAGRYVHPKGSAAAKHLYSLPLDVFSRSLSFF